MFVGQDQSPEHTLEPPAVDNYRITWTVPYEAITREGLTSTLVKIDGYPFGFVVDRRESNFGCFITMGSNDYDLDVVFFLSALNSTGACISNSQARYYSFRQSNDRHPADWGSVALVSVDDVLASAGGQHPPTVTMCCDIGLSPPSHASDGALPPLQSTGMQSAAHHVSGPVKPLRSFALTRIFRSNPAAVAAATVVWTVDEEVFTADRPRLSPSFVIRGREYRLRVAPTVVKRYLCTEVQWNASVVLVDPSSAVRVLGAALQAAGGDTTMSPQDPQDDVGAVLYLHWAAHNPQTNKSAAPVTQNVKVKTLSDPTPATFGIVVTGPTLELVCTIADKSSGTGWPDAKPTIVTEGWDDDLCGPVDISGSSLPPAVAALFGAVSKIAVMPHQRLSAARGAFGDAANRNALWTLQSSDAATGIFRWRFNVLDLDNNQLTHTSPPVTLCNRRYFFRVSLREHSNTWCFVFHVFSLLEDEKAEVYTHVLASLLNRDESHNMTFGPSCHEFKAGSDADRVTWVTVPCRTLSQAESGYLFQIPDPSAATQSFPLYCLWEVTINDHTAAEEASRSLDICRNGDVPSLCATIPARLTQEERGRLDLLRSALSVSEYVNVVDTASRSDRTARIISQLKEFGIICQGLSLASSYRQGKKLVDTFASPDAEERKVGYDYLASMIEVGRRFKRMNPDLMRTDYGPLILMLQDANLPAVERSFEWLASKPVLMVSDLLPPDELAKLASHPDFWCAANPVVTLGKTPAEITAARAQKESALAAIVALHGPKGEQVLRSLDDAFCFQRDNVNILSRMIDLLTLHFPPDKPVPGCDLAISAGVGGSCLTHSHRKHFQYVLESLTLWRNIMREMCALWGDAEDDLLDVKHYPYNFSDTGQGYHRVQHASRVGRRMFRILASTKRELGGWVGSSVVHLGDRDVPNALVFIDKYTQIPRMLKPILSVVAGMDDIASKPGIDVFLKDMFGGCDGAKMEILRSFFRFGFDGSGDDGGSCIDGRLTSAWNWCNKISSKRFYPLFQMTGFASFDGEW